MIKAVIFKDKMEEIDGRKYFSAESKLEIFCAKHNINQEDIVSVSLSSDKNDIYNSILLVYNKKG